VTEIGVHIGANYGKEDGPDPTIPKIPQETLAEIVGTTRRRLISS
jgi:hypothetical protein